jgi:hypothetical protein
MSAALPLPKGVSYRKARDLLMTHPIRKSEVPIESYISLPLPTLRWHMAAWASFAAPSIRRTDQPFRLGLPDRWWAIDARAGRLAAYAKESVIAALGVDATSASLTDGLIELKPTTRSIEEQRSNLTRLASAFDLITDFFFEGRAAPGSNRREADAALRAAVPEELLPFYRGLAPDFCSWILV